MKKLLLFTISCILAISSCDTFLDVKPTSQADSKSSIGAISDADVMMTGIMRNMLSSSYYGLYMFLYADAKGGDLCVGARGRGYDLLYVFDHAPAAGSYSVFWGQIYYILAQVNNLVNSIDAIIEEGSASDAVVRSFNHVKAQALTVRAICYYDLVRLYGKPYDMDKSSLGVPLILEVLDATAEPTRATVEQIYTQIVSDLTQAAPLFIQTQRVNGFINYYANIAMQARVYLQMQNYSGALTAAEAIINSGLYTLYSNDTWLSTWSRQFQSESIFELAVLPTETDQGRGSLGSMINNSDLKPTYSIYTYYIASDAFLARLEEDPDDVRLGLMAPDEKSETSFHAGVRNGACYKYLGGVNTPGDGKATATAVNVKVIRLSEIYLIAAEAALSTSNRTKAAEYLQAIRKRAPNLAPATADNITLKMIQDERSKELFGEGHRFFDMMRWNESITFNDYWAQSPIITRPETIDRTYYKTILPIDQNELNANPALVSQQNPGY